MSSHFLWPYLGEHRWSESSGSISKDQNELLSVVCHRKNIQTLFCVKLIVTFRGKQRPAAESGATLTHAAQKRFVTGKLSGDTGKLDFFYHLTAWKNDIFSWEWFKQIHASCLAANTVITEEAGWLAPVDQNFKSYEIRLFFGQRIKFCLCTDDINVWMSL